METVLSFLKQYWKILTGIVATITLVLKMDKLVESLREWGGAGVTRPAGSSQFLLSEPWGWGSPSSPSRSSPAFSFVELWLSISTVSGGSNGAGARLWTRPSGA
jgi:hypothetical protein